MSYNKPLHRTLFFAVYRHQNFSLSVIVFTVQFATMPSINTIYTPLANEITNTIVLISSDTRGRCNIRYFKLWWLVMTLVLYTKLLYIYVTPREEPSALYYPRRVCFYEGWISTCERTAMRITRTGFTATSLLRFFPGILNRSGTGETTVLRLGINENSNLWLVASTPHRA